MPTLFERIIAREIPAEIVYEDAHVVAFRDIAPVAPVHIVLVPRAPYPGVADVPDEGDHTRLLNAAKTVAEREGLASYRLVINQGEDAGQSVPHLHLHLIGGRKLAWPPG